MMRSPCPTSNWQGSRYFGTSERFWLNLQTRYDLEMEKEGLGKRLEREVSVLERSN